MRARTNTVKSNGQITSAHYFTERLSSQLPFIFDYPCTIVEAPMGYGKTTAILEFLKGRDAQVLWLKVHERSISAFWSSFCKQFDAIDSECARNLSKIEFSGDSASREKILELLQQSNWSGNVVIVIDDYHLISTPEVNRFFEFMMWNELSNLHLVLAARYTRFENIEELKLKGYIHHITKEDLEFSPEDIVNYYKLCGLKIEQEESHEIFAYTEGWVSAVYLMMLDFRAEKMITANTNVTKLLRKTVYEPFSEDIKRFLLCICLFDSFTLKQCHDMWHLDNTKTLLNEIVGKNAFVTYDEKQKVYQMHNLFSEFLRAIFDEWDDDLKKCQYAKAASWFRSNKDYITALKYYQLAGDYDRLLSAYEEDQGNSFHAEHRDDLLGYFQECPFETKQAHPIALLIFAIFLFSCNEEALFTTVCEELVSIIEVLSIVDIDAAKLLQGEFELLLIFTAYNDIDRMIDHIQKAFLLLKGPAKFVDTKGGWTLGSPSVLYMFYRESGKLNHHVERLKLGMSDYNLLAKGHGRGGEYIMEAERDYNGGSLVNAEVGIHKALHAANTHQQLDIKLCGVYLLARVLAFKGQFTEACDQLRRLREEIESEGQYVLLQTVDLCEASIQASFGSISGIPKWILDGDFGDSKLYFPVMAFYNIVFGRTLLVKGDYLKILGSQDHFLGVAEAFPNLLGKIYTYIYVAAANERIFRREAAMESLEKAMKIAFEDDVLLPFVENSDYIKSLLIELQRDSRYQNSITRILCLVETYEKAVNNIIKEHFSKQNPVLTEREIEIARLVAEGMSNSEIGNSLYISPNTVKTSLKRIFGKLGINSRSLLKQYVD